ncbi:Protein of unknown function [Cotesia congregata]|uniref:Uncharacterized protein n=1 Tax=Cotesia congregata TaxID=51543 RepID=A0A8J2GZ64_COTCN|nr:Protein of unknown function [Cotesia congregata]
MSVPTKPMLALVQWIGGDYDKTYTPGVPVDWIFDFDLLTFDPTNEDESYVIEWRESKKNNKLTQSWKYFDARVVKTSPGNIGRACFTLTPRTYDEPKGGGNSRTGGIKVEHRRRGPASERGARKPRGE